MMGLPGWVFRDGISAGRHNPCPQAGRMAATVPGEILLCENHSLHTQSRIRLLVVRLGAMGDILHALPAMTALRQAHPSWQIGWVVEPRWQALLRAGTEGPSHPREQRPLDGNRDGDQGNEEAGISGQGPGTSEGRGTAMPVADRLHFAQTREWKRRPLSAQTRSEISALRRELRAAGYDVVLDLQGAIRSAAIARLSGARRRIGEARPREWPAHWFFTERIVTRGAHVIEQDVELASAVAGDALAPVAPLLPVDSESERWCDAWLAATVPGACQPIALIAPGAGWGAKRWPPERYTAVARGLAERGFRVLVNCGPGEETLAAPIVASGAAVPLRVTLPQLIAMTRRITLCVGGDTGPLHLASALGRLVVGIYGPTDPSRNGPFGTHCRVLRSAESRRDHTRRPAPDPAMLTITPEDVLRAACELVNEETAR
jgi:heptosyltransferase I